MVVVDVTTVDRAMETRTAKPEKLAVRGQVLRQGKKSVRSPEDSHYKCKYLASIFCSHALRCNQQNDPKRDVLKYFVSRCVGVGRPTEHNLSENENEKEEHWRVQGIFRQHYVS